MASPHLRQEDLRVLDQTRQRLSLLATNLESQKSAVEISFEAQTIETSLPTWESIQNRASILATSVSSIVEHISKNSDMLNKTVVYPSTNYPGRTQEPLLGQLLRKKLEPQVEDRVDEGRTVQKEAEESNEEDIEELWNWANDWIGERVKTYVLEEAGEEYTEEEKAMGIENVNTGLRRNPEDDESEEEDEDEEMEDVGVGVTAVRTTSVGQVEFDMAQVKKAPGGKSRSLDDILRFSTSGLLGGNK